MKSTAAGFGGGGIGPSCWNIKSALSFRVEIVDRDVVVRTRREGGLDPVGDVFGLGGRCGRRFGFIVPDWARGVEVPLPVQQGGWLPTQQRCSSLLAAARYLPACL